MDLSLIVYRYPFKYKHSIVSEVEFIKMVQENWQSYDVSEDQSIMEHIVLRIKLLKEVVSKRMWQKNMAIQAKFLDFEECIKGIYY